MSSPRQTDHKPETDRTGGGPGSSHQGGGHGHTTRERHANDHAALGEPTNPPKSRVSGGGGERDSHHTHDAEKKGERRGY
jgi:hypothetical protein